MERQARPRDETRRRVLLGLGAVGVGALGTGAVRALSTRPETVVESPTTTELRVTAERPSPTSAPASSSTTTTKSPGTSTSVEPTTTTLPMRSVVAVCREAWGAAPATAGMDQHVPVRLTLHHTAVSQTALTQGPARARQHQRYHQSLGWADLAYHFLVDRSGLAYQGRDVSFRGDTGTEYDPTGHFLVGMEGDFDVQEPTAAQVETTVALFGWASQHYDIDAATLAGHGTYAVTSCPGSSVSAMIPDLAAAVAEIGPVTIDLACGADGAELVAHLEAG